MLTVLPIELIQVIASKDKDIWYHLYQYHDRFKELAKTPALINLYQNLFVEYIINKNGTKYTKLFGLFHSINDQPAKVWNNGTKEWYKEGKLHREDGPAVEYSNGNKYWYLHGKRHREGRPAVERSDGEKRWYIHGQLHREDGPAIERSDGSKEWYLEGKRQTNKY